MALSEYILQYTLIFLALSSLIACDGLLDQFLQPDNADELHELNSENRDNTSCTRECVQGAPYRICYYQFTLEQYNVLNVACGDCPDNISHCYNPGCVTADGIERGILTVNRRIPGPSIQVCLGDRIVVDVKNGMPGKQTTIHWHGIYMKGTPYMDGVPMVTQCSIMSEQTFRYDFTANNSGTYFWHSHEAFQKMDGLAGSLIVREPRSADHNSDFYDYDLPDHVVVIMDWYHIDADTHFPGLLTHDRSQDAQAYLIAGRGRNNRTSKGYKYPLSVFRVSSGKKYRFRIIGAICSECPVRIKFEEHQMLVIATDGKPIDPVLVDSLVLEAGLRFDVVIDANKASSSYWIRAQGLAQCSWFDIQQLSILQYEDSDLLEPITTPIYMPYLPQSTELNSENATCGEGQHGICMHQLTGKLDMPADILKERPDVSYILKFDMYYYSKQELFNSGHYYRYQQPAVRTRQLAGEINNISCIIPPSPLLTQEADIPANAFCPVSPEGNPYCQKENCQCIHMINIPLDAVVQLVVVDQSRVGSLNHPFHLHGYSFAVMDMGTFEKENKTLEQILQEFNLNRLHKIQKPAFVDTIAVPTQGYVILRFKADNPGYWMLHCHILVHHETGMFTIFKVGNRSQMSIIPDGFPRCGNYLPEFSYE